MFTQILQKPKLIKKNIFLDSTIWSLASHHAKQNNTSVAQEIRDKLAKVYNDNNTDFAHERVKNRRKLAGSISSGPNSDQDGAVNHNDIYTL